ncbi:secreted RxLR effector protein 161-like [Raphanus sativus]|uniref:Secreted RxLR effector protein 161-like n=1 Tax=Raphanus sativus TaxID=3726 RepID=A0A9W3D0F8_RAPSA|nr:secreted RxLR effector protein 161-like [Raphanus sativus]
MDSIPYASAVRSVMYAMVGSRPDLAFAVGLVSRFMSKPNREHWEAVKCILWYLQGAMDVCLTFSKSDHFGIEGFSDPDYSTDLDKRRSMTGYVFQVGGNIMSWRSALQHVIALSTTEAEYMTLSEATKERLSVHPNASAQVNTSKITKVETLTICEIVTFVNNESAQLTMSREIPGGITEVRGPTSLI